MQITDVILDHLDVSAPRNSLVSLTKRGQDLLSSTGRFYLVAVKANDVPGLQRRVQDKFNIKSEVCCESIPQSCSSPYFWLSQVVLQRRAGREHLFVVRFMR